MATDTRVLDILVRARAVLDNPWDWCQDADAMTSEGDETSPRDPDAVKWCAVGVIDYVTKPSSDGAYHRDYDAVETALTTLQTTASALYPNSGGVEEINDRLGHDAVLAMYDAAIATLDS